jgi:DNA-directed RNA polymerase subunit beta
VVSEDGGDVVVREEEDELLRAAEELGIDLQPVAGRATARDPDAQEVEDGADRVDAEGELSVANDEDLPEEFEEDVLDGDDAEKEGDDELAPDDELEPADVDE